MSQKKLHLGASRLEKLCSDSLKIFLNKNWTHLGDKVLSNPQNRSLTKIDYSLTNFIPYYFKSGEHLPFKDDYFSFIFSEHFFEHLFLGDAIELFRESYRVLKYGGVFRIVVPDADLRPIPETIGFPGENYKYNDPRKHKSRWSIYGLKPLLEIVGFKVNPLKYYNKNIELIDRLNAIDIKYYRDCADVEMVTDTCYIKRINSLIVDGIKC